MKPKPDPTLDYWSVSQVAAYLGRARSTVSAYLARGQMPKPDTDLDGKRGWKPQTIITWAENRPGLGWRRGKRAD